jgi:hypothetical protein
MRAEESVSGLVTFKATYRDEHHEGDETNAEVMDMALVFGKDEPT